MMQLKERIQASQADGHIENNRQWAQWCYFTHWTAAASTPAGCWGNPKSWSWFLQLHLTKTSKHKSLLRVFQNIFQISPLMQRKPNLSCYKLQLNVSSFFPYMCGFSSFRSKVRLMLQTNPTWQHLFCICFFYSCFVLYILYFDFYFVFLFKFFKTDSWNWSCFKKIKKIKKRKNCWQNQKTKNKRITVRKFNDKMQEVQV